MDKLSYYDKIEICDKIEIKIIWSLDYGAKPPLRTLSILKGEKNE